MKPEQFFPTRWILRGMARQEFADHLRRLRAINRKLARKCVYHAHWVGVYPARTVDHRDQSRS